MMTLDAAIEWLQYLALALLALCAVLLPGHVQAWSRHDTDTSDENHVARS